MVRIFSKPPAPDTRAPCMDNVLIDLTVTAHTSARTGIQRVALSLANALAGRTSAIPVTFDPHEAAWRKLRPWEQRHLTSGEKTWSRSVSWPWHQRLLGPLRRAAGYKRDLFPLNAGLIAPEIFNATTAPAVPGLLGRIQGPRVALFYDAIALQRPELSPLATVGRFPSYLHSLTRFDGIAAISADSRDTLLDYWHWAGWDNLPPVVAIPLGMDMPAASMRIKPAPPGTRPVILSVGTLEGRKNHVALLAACEGLWAAGLEFDLWLVGMAQRQTGRAALAEIHRLQAAGRPLRYGGPVGDDALEQAYAACTFTVYPSLMEGFGLPVLESLARGKPCVCLGSGALGESARGGGCLALPNVTSPTLAGAIRELLTVPATLQRLQTEARARHFRTWADYTDDLLGWMGTLTRRPS